MFINNINVAHPIVDIKNETLTKSNYQWATASYNGFAWDTRSTNGALGNTNVTVSPNNARMPYNLIKDVGKATRFELRPPLAAYRAVSGQITVWGR